MLREAEVCWISLSSAAILPFPPYKRLQAKGGMRSCISLSCRFFTKPDPCRLSIFEETIHKPMRKLSIFIATSVDGYIAKPNDDLGFLKLVEKKGEDYGYTKFTETIDTLIIGRKTYDYVVKAIGASHYDTGERDVYIITRSPRPAVGKTIFYTGDLGDLVRRLKSEE